MRRRTLITLVTCLLFASLALAQDTAAKRLPAAPTQALMQTILDAWGSMNPDTVAEYYDHAPTDVFYDISPVKYDGWSAYAAGVKQLLGTLKSVKFTLHDDATVRRSLGFAWGTATVNTVMTDKAGKTTTLDCRWTVIWQRKGANWLIVHDHFSAPMEPPK